MKNFTIAAAAAGFAAAFVGLAAPALAAPSGSASAADTISSLEADGNRVVVNRQGSTPLADAEVVRVRQGAPIREYGWDPRSWPPNRSSSIAVGAQVDDQGDRRILENVGNVYFVDVR